MVTKDTILRQLSKTGNSIADKFDEIYKSEIDVLAQEMAISYELLLKMINEKSEELSNNDFQSALLYWTALNSILSAIDLLRRGYTKEPQMIMRNVLEILAVAYGFHENPNRYQNFMANPKKFGATRSITIIKKVHPIIGQWYGMLSDFTHVSSLHILPHKADYGLCVGGIFDPEDQHIMNINLMSIIGTLDVLNSVLELTFLPYISTPRFWKETEPDTYTYHPNKQRVKLVMGSMGRSINSL